MRRTIKQKIELINEIFSKLDFSYGDEVYTNMKILPIKNSTWTNLCTHRAETVKNIYTLAMLSSGYAKLINAIKVDGTYNDEDLDFLVDFKVNYQHANIGGRNSITFRSPNLTIKITYQPFCNPVTPTHLLEDFGADILLSTNLETQNLDDSFGDVNSVSNSCYDCMLRNGALAGSSYIELLLGRGVSQIESSIKDGSFNELISPIKSTAEDEIWVKPKTDDHYVKKTKHYYEANKSLYSSYYPVITYEEIQELKLEFVKVDKDLACFGLGSAGTAILDLLVRCNYLKSIILLDYDTVELKNLRNQWYKRSNIHLYKTKASKDIIAQISNNIITDTYNSRVEDFITEKSNYSFKYLVSGFDNLEARKLVYEAIVEGKLEAEYLIDCRYLDLACSVYFINTSDKEQMKYYIKQLDADMKLIKTEDVKPFTFEQFDEYWQEGDYYRGGCGTMCSKMGFRSPCGEECGGINCKNNLYAQYLDTFGKHHRIGYSDNSCIKHNFIDIYKYVGAIVMGAIRNIENNVDKPFTHLEAETNVNGLPACMVVRG